MNTLSYIPGTRPKSPAPLARFLPPLEDGVAAAWLEGHVEAGAWVLDPFGVSPQQAVRAARRGYRVLVAANNPVARFLLEVATDPPSESDFKAALAELAISRKGDERLESHLRDLYLTQCSKCQRMVEAKAFLWRRDAETPFARVYECPDCGDFGERLPAPADAARAAEAAASANLHHARVLERVAPLGDPNRGYVEEALSYYLPRAIYVLATLINRLDGLSLSPPRRRALTALLLTACDKANTLWPHPVERPRPRQLIVPGQFYENNIWLALEEGLELWANTEEPVPLVAWPEPLPESGGICLFEGRLKDLAENLQKTPVQVVLTSIPRPNQAFWTLSALWAGWLWGRETAETFKIALRRRRYDWGWHASALQAVFSHLANLLKPEMPFFALLAEPEPSFLSAALLAASPGFELEGLALRTRHDPVQIVWKRRKDESKSEKDHFQIRRAVKEYLQARGEPATYLHLHALALTGFARRPGLLLPRETADESLTRLHAAIEEALLNDKNLTRFDGSEHSLEVGLWGLADPAGQEVPLPDRVEMAVVRYVSRHPGCKLIDIERDLYPQFPGLLTPPKSLVAAVLESYCQQENNGWRLRDEDSPSARIADLKEMEALIKTLGTRLGHKTQQVTDKLLIWDEKDKPIYAFYLLASAVVGDILRGNPYPLERSLIVLPGGRASLLAYKQKRNPVLLAQSQGWRFVKFRVLRALEKIPLINSQTWEEQVSSDPIEGAPPGQMMMF